MNLVKDDKEYERICSSFNDLLDGKKLSKSGSPALALHRVRLESKNVVDGKSSSVNEVLDWVSRYYNLLDDLPVKYFLVKAKHVCFEELDRLEWEDILRNDFTAEEMECIPKGEYHIYERLRECGVLLSEDEFDELPDKCYRIFQHNGALPDSIRALIELILFNRVYGELCIFEPEMKVVAIPNRFEGFTFLAEQESDGSSFINQSLGYLLDDPNIVSVDGK